MKTVCYTSAARTKGTNNYSWGLGGMSTQKRKENKRSRRGKRLVLPYAIAKAVLYSTM